MRIGDEDLVAQVGLEAVHHSEDDHQGHDADGHASHGDKRDERHEPWLRR